MENGRGRRPRREPEVWRARGGCPLVYYYTNNTVKNFEQLKDNFDSAKSLGDI